MAAPTMREPNSKAMTALKANHVRLPEYTIGLKMRGMPMEPVKIKTSADLYPIVKNCFDLDQIEWTESMVVIALNRANCLLNFYKLSQGGITGTVADPRVIFQFALLTNATTLIIAHNHPSGNLRPSVSDEELTAKIVAAGKLLDIKVLDHLIISKDSYYSFAEEGLIY
jgi:DNA repair protein RadC